MGAYRAASAAVRHSTATRFLPIRAPDSLTERLPRHADGWHDVTCLADTRLAEAIPEDPIDVLVDLRLRTVGNRLPAFTQKPAPAQVTYLAYCGTAEPGGMDYCLTDPTSTRPAGKRRLTASNRCGSRRPTGVTGRPSRRRRQTHRRPPPGDLRRLVVLRATMRNQMRLTAR